LDTSSTDLDDPSLRAQLEESRKEVDQLRLDLKDVKEVAGTLSLKSNSLNKQNEKKEEEIKMIQQEVAYLNLKLNDSAKEVALLDETRKEVDQLRLDLKDVKELVGTLSLKSNSLDKENEKKEEEIKRIQQEVASLNLKLNDSAKEVALLDETRKEVDQLRLDLKDAIKLVGTLSLKSNTLNKQNERQEEEIKMTQQDVASLNLKLTESAKEAAQLNESRKEADRLGLDLKSAKEQVGTLSVINKSLLKKIEEKEKQINSKTQQEVASLQVELNPSADKKVTTKPEKRRKNVFFPIPAVKKQAAHGKPNPRGLALARQQQLEPLSTRKRGRHIPSGRYVESKKSDSSPFLYRKVSSVLQSTRKDVVDSLWIASSSVPSPAKASAPAKTPPKVEDLVDLCDDDSGDDHNGSESQEGSKRQRSKLRHGHKEFRHKADGPSHSLALPADLDSGLALEIESRWKLHQSRPSRQTTI
jgi:chromosome segregation ATPase